jgi:hypothetical protein
MRFFKQLFNAGRTETNGDILLFIIFETVIIYQVILISWRWAIYIPHLSRVAAPVGIANFMDISFMFTAPYALINAALITLFVLLGYFRKGRFFYLLAILGMHLQYAARFSQGKVSHGTGLTGMALLILALTALFIIDREERRKVAVGLVIFFISVGYTSAAVCKLVATGPQWIEGHHLILWMKERGLDLYSQHGAFSFNTIQQILLNHHILATVALACGLITELCSFLLCLRKTRWIEATLLIGMHIGIVLMMDISFIYFLFILIVLGYPWARLFDYWLQRYSQSSINYYLEQRRVAS